MSANGKSGRIRVTLPITVGEFAALSGLTHFELAADLMHAGVFATVNSPLTEDSLRFIAERHHLLLEIIQPPAGMM